MINAKKNLFCKLFVQYEAKFAPSASTFMEYTWTLKCNDAGWAYTDSNVVPLNNHFKCDGTFATTALVIFFVFAWISNGGMQFLKIM